MMLGLGLYIGEGGKTDGLIRIINSDPKVIKLAIKWFKFSFGIKTENIKVGDIVLTHKNKFENVTEIFSRNYKGKVYK